MKIVNMVNIQYQKYQTWKKNTVVNTHSLQAMCMDTSIKSA